MAENQTTVRTETRMGEVGEYDVEVPIDPAKPLADGAKDQKPLPGADDEAAKAAATKEQEGAKAEAQAEEETPEQIEAKKQSRFQRRLDRQKTARIEAETEARLLREQLAKAEAGKEKTAGESQEPKRESFDDYETYLRALAMFDAEQTTAKALKADRDERQKSEREQGDRAGFEKMAKEWNEREKSFQAATKDYTEIVQQFVDEGLDSLSDMARRAIVESDVGPQLLYHLSRNDKEAERIAGLGPLQQVKELARLEAKLEKPAATKGKTVSDAPNPVTGTKAGVSAISGFRENMSDAEYREWRKSNGARWAR